MSSRRDIWLNGEHFVLTDDEYRDVRHALGPPKRLDPDDLRGALELIRAASDPDADVVDRYTDVSEPLPFRWIARDEPDPDPEPSAADLPDCTLADDERERCEPEYDVEPVSPSTAREYAEYWVQIYGTGTQSKGIHLPGEDSTRDEPTTKCERSDDALENPDARLVDKDLEVYPEGYAPERICTNCRRRLAIERGDQRVE